MGEDKQWKTDSLEGLARGSKVWYRTHDDDYEFGTILALPDPSCIKVQLEGLHGRQTTREVTAEELKPANPAILEGVEDLTHLSYLNEPSLLHNLRARHRSDNIYTTAGPVLIAVNPYKRLPLYGPDVVAKYRSTGRERCKDPHPFAVADATYAAMQADGQNQSVVISGESGAGKTETTKIVMRYLAGLAGGTGIEDRVLQTNPILEGFGNAKTLRNDNSSRFGKLIQIYFNGRTIAGANIRTYLLEKSRVVQQGKGERSYHIFYQIVAGATAEERAELHLPGDPEEFRYLSQSGCSTINGVDDATEFKEMKNAMTQVGISADEQAAIFRVVASVMWLGNVKFEEQGDETVRVVEDEALEAVSSLLRCDQGLLCKALTGRQIQAGREVIWQELRLGQVCDARDALAKALYAMQFDWLVERINTSLRDPKRTTKALAINILDIYGFEHFKVNSFEQLCINYANERLQQQFNKYLFKLEQEEYSREGIDWAHVDFEDNQSCVDLIEQKMPKGVGLLSLLDEECVFPKATDETYGEKLHANLGSHPNFSFKGHIKNEFTVHHYAGGVTYTTDGFLDKNKDAISLDLLQALQGSSLKLLQDLASTMENRQTAKNSLTVGSFFREQLRTLVDTLESTNLHFIRCIKPNPEQAPLLIENSLVLAQLRCCGVLEVVRIARAGYPTRYLHEQFADRYHILMPEAAGGGSFSGPPLDMCNRILKQFQIDPAMYQVGHTKLFFRAGLLGRMEDTWERMVNGAYTIQAFMRMAVVRSRFLHLRAAAIRCQANRKGMMQRMAYAELLRRHRAALAIASRWKAYQIRRTFLRTVAAAWAIQMAYRRWRLSLRLKIRRGQISKRRASEAKVEEERKREAARWDRVRDEFGGDWEAIRATMAWAGSIKAKYGGEEKVEAALASWEAGDHNPTAAPQPVLQASATTVPMASPADIAELERLRADREALLDDLQAEKGRREECEEKLEVAEEQWMTQMAALQEVLANVKREIAGTDVEAAVTVYAGDLEKFRDRLPAHHVAEAGVPRPTSSAPRAPPPVAKTTQSISETNMVAIQAINRLNDELEMRAQVYDDDIDFIREVKEGITEAPDMDPVHELRNLQHRFEAWKRDFKQRLHETKHLIRRGDAGATRRPSQTSVGNASLDTSMDLSESMELDPSQLHHTPSYSSNGGNTHQYRSPPNPYQHEKPSKVGYDSGTDASVNSYIAADMPAPPFSVAPESGSMEDKKKKKGFGKMLGFNRRAK